MDFIRDFINLLPLMTGVTESLTVRTITRTNSTVRLFIKVLFDFCLTQFLFVLFFVQLCKVEIVLATNTGAQIHGAFQRVTSATQYVTVQTLAKTNTQTNVYVIIKLLMYFVF